MIKRLPIFAVIVINVHCVYALPIFRSEPKVLKSDYIIFTPTTSKEAQNLHTDYLKGLNKYQNELKLVKGFGEGTPIEIESQKLDALYQLRSAKLEDLRNQIRRSPSETKTRSLEKEIAALGKQVDELKNLKDVAQTLSSVQNLLPVRREPWKKGEEVALPQVKTEITESPIIQQPRQTRVLTPREKLTVLETDIIGDLGVGLGAEPTIWGPTFTRDSRIYEELIGVKYNPPHLVFSLTNSSYNLLLNKLKEFDEQLLAIEKDPTINTDAIRRSRYTWYKLLDDVFIDIENDLKGRYSRVGFQSNKDLTTQLNKLRKQYDDGKKQES